MYELSEKHSIILETDLLKQNNSEKYEKKWIKSWFSVVYNYYFITPSSCLQITGIMFNPDGADTGREWIEIKLNSSDGCINLTEYKLFEEDTNHNIYKYDSDIFCKYAILSSDVNKFLQDYPYSNNTNNSNQSDIKLYKSTFSLSNSGEDIAIKKGNEIIDEINYTLLIENLDTIEGHSLEYYSDYWRVSELSKGNPGRIIVENTTANITINNETTINTTINDIAIIA